LVFMEHCRYALLVGTHSLPYVLISRLLISRISLVNFLFSIDPENELGSPSFVPGGEDLAFGRLLPTQIISSPDDRGSFPVMPVVLREGAFFFLLSLPTGRTTFATLYRSPPSPGLLPCAHTKFAPSCGFCDVAGPANLDFSFTT